MRPTYLAASNSIAQEYRSCPLLLCSTREDDHIVQTKFGGSVQKGTYVTGLSDIDVLLIVNPVLA